MDLETNSTAANSNNINNNSGSNTSNNSTNTNPVSMAATTAGAAAAAAAAASVSIVSPGSTLKSSYDIDVIRLIGQHLINLGLKQTVNSLLEESGLRGLEQPLAERFRQYIMAGDWDTASSLVEELSNLIASTQTQTLPQPLPLATSQQQNNQSTTSTIAVAATTAAAATTTPAANATEQLDKKKSANAIRLAIAEQKFLEYMEDKQHLKALTCLRLEIAPFSEDVKHVQHLARLVMCKSAEDLKMKTNWPGKGHKSRQLVVERIQRYIPPALLLPPRRLDTLLSQAIQLQRSRCTLHLNQEDEDDEQLAAENSGISSSSTSTSRSASDALNNIILNGSDYRNATTTTTTTTTNNNNNNSADNNVQQSNGNGVAGSSTATTASSSSSSLMSLAAISQSVGERKYVDLKQDHSCYGEKFPLQLRQEIDSHRAQVWFCKFSDDGTKLATGGLGGKVKIWLLNPIERKLVEKCTLDCKSDSITCLSWSPNGVYLLVCGSQDRPDLWIWNVNKETVHNMISHSDDESTTTCSWHMSGEKFAAASTKGNFHIYDLDGNRPGSREGVRVQCLSFLHKDPSHILAADTLNRIRSYAIKDMSLETDEEDVLEERNPIISFVIDKEDKYIAVNLMNQGVHLWDYRLKTLLRMFPGVIQRNTTIHSSFSTIESMFLASGSEDGKVYIYNINKDQPVAILIGHSRCVNCVAWNPKYPEILVSVSDDRTIRLWAPIGSRHRKIF